MEPCDRPSVFLGGSLLPGQRHLRWALEILKQMLRVSKNLYAHFNANSKSSQTANAVRFDMTFTLRVQRKRLELPMEHINCWWLTVFKYSLRPASTTFSPSTLPWLLLGKTVACDPLLHYNSVNYTRPHVLLVICARFPPDVIASLSVSNNASLSGLTVWVG